jgi:hypothetical protein
MAVKLIGRRRKCEKSPELRAEDRRGVAGL